MRKNAFRFVAAAGIASIALLPALASAQYRGGSYQGQSDMQQGQVYWNNDRPYYYDRDHQRHYMNRDQERQWIQRQDPDWYRQHENEYQSDQDRFYNDWRTYQQGRGHYRHDNDNNNGYHRGEDNGNSDRDDQYRR